MDDAIPSSLLAEATPLLFALTVLFLIKSLAFSFEHIDTSYSRPSFSFFCDLGTGVHRRSSLFHRSSFFAGAFLGRGCRMSPSALKLPGTVINVRNPTITKVEGAYQIFWQILHLADSFLFRPIPKYLTRRPKPLSILMQ